MRIKFECSRAKLPVSFRIFFGTLVHLRPGTFSARGLLFQPATFLQSFSNDPLKLSVGTAELVGCPFFYRIHRVRIYPQYKVLYCRFFLCHLPLTILSSPYYFYKYKCLCLLFLPTINGRHFKYGFFKHRSSVIRKKKTNIRKVRL